ncbi:type II toxin-antitoxin system RatA family toxin [Streptomyces sp. NPDC055099]
MQNSEFEAATYRVTIDAPPGHVLATLRDVAAYPDWQPEISLVEVLRLDGLGQPAEARLTVTSMGMSMALTLALEHGAREMRWSLVEGDFVTRNDARYTVAETADGRTDLTLRQDLAMKWHLPAVVAKPMIARRIGATMDALKRRAEQTAAGAAGRQDS